MEVKYKVDIKKTMNLYQSTHKGFSEKEIAEAEKRIGAKLPDNYRFYLKQYGLDSINQAFHGLRAPIDIWTTYQIIKQDLEEEWQEEFEDAVKSGTQDEYKNNEYFTLWKLPVEEWHKVTDNYVLLWTENQGIWNAGYRLADLKSGNPDPLVYISTEDDFITFKKCTDSMEEFIQEMFRQATGELDDI